MYKSIKKKILQNIIAPIANTEGKLEDKADYIFGCLMRSGIVSDKDRTSFFNEFFKHINKVNDDITRVLDKGVAKALKKMNISIEEDVKKED